MKRPTVSDEAARPTSSIASKQGEINRLSRELNEAQEQQSATSEVLRVISSSRGDLEPVFGTMLEHAVRICDATFGIIYRWDGELLHLLAVHNAPAALVDARRRSALRPSSLIRHMVETRTTAHVADVAAHKDYIERHPGAVAAVELGGTRTYLAVPMLKENELIGALSLSRQVVRPFTDKQIELVKNFAAQAVIAIENARLLNELRQRTVDLTEALGQQTATADVLQVISSSPGDLEAVFATMLDKAVSICNATFGELYRWNGETFQLASMHNTPPQFIEERQSAQPIRPNTNTITGRLVATKSTAQIVDLAADPSYIDRSRPSYVAAVELGGVRTALAVPMIKDDALIGMITLCRQEVRAFTERQIVLVENFAAQAVIAIENARLLNELRQRTTDLTEALEQQTAASQVLQVISSSPGELQPVFQAMLENATRICEAKFGVLFRYDDAGFEPAALSNAPPAYANFVWSRGQFFPQTGNGLDRLRRAQTVIHSVDEAAEPVPTNSARLAGARSQVLVPMLKEGKLAGAIAIYRQEVRPFTDKQIELVKNFAAQAVIAIENARLLNELKQSLEEQTATAEVLSVISSSPGKLEPVFQAMLENAVRICDAKFGNIYRWDGDALHLAASHNTPTAYAEQRRRLPLRFNQMPESLRRMIATMAADPSR